MLDEFLLVLGQVGQGEEVLEPGGGAHLHIEVMTMTISADLWTSVDISPPGHWCNDIMNISDHLWRSVDIFEHLWTSVTIYDHLWTSLNICEHLWISLNNCEHEWSSVNICDQWSLTIFEHMWTFLNICENVSEHQWRSLNSSEHQLIYFKIYVDSCGHLKTSCHMSLSSLRMGLKLDTYKRICSLRASDTFAFLQNRRRWSGS